jgi:hypothetical protein
MKEPPREYVAKAVAPSGKLHLVDLNDDDWVSTLCGMGLVITERVEEEDGARVTTSAGKKWKIITKDAMMDHKDRCKVCRVAHTHRAKGVYRYRPGAWKFAWQKRKLNELKHMSRRG